MADTRPHEPQAEDMVGSGTPSPGSPLGQPRASGSPTMENITRGVAEPCSAPAPPTARRPSPQLAPAPPFGTRTTTRLAPAPHPLTLLSLL